MRKPVIGITVNHTDYHKQYRLPFAYSIAIDKAGGLPLMLPYLVDLGNVGRYVDLLDGLVLAGGADLDPACYGETYNPRCRPVDPARERFERTLLAEIERRRLPTLGICMGCQLMNLARGGSLHQFLPELPRPAPIEHRQLDLSVEVRHPISLVQDCLASSAIGKTDVMANSSHKQAIRSVGRGLRVIATSPDAVIEGIEDPAMPFWIGVQWHPERLHDEPEHLGLFRRLVQEAG